MAKQRFVFNATDKKRLGEFGVTSPQLVTLQRRLPVIAELLESRTPLADVRDVLLEARKHARLLVRIAVAADAGKPAQSEAIGHLGMAAGMIAGEPMDGTGDGTQPELPNFAAAARLLQSITERAVEMAPTRQRRGRVDPGRAVSLVLEALRTPEDAASRSLALKVKPTPDSSRRNPFADIAMLVFERATGGQKVPIRAAVDAWKERPQEGELKLVVALSLGSSCSQGG